MISSPEEPEDQEEEVSFPPPDDSNESVDTAFPGEWNNPEWMAAHLTRWMRHAVEQNDWESWRRPD
jgi:hypothetical protein